MEVSRKLSYEPELSFSPQSPLATAIPLILLTANLPGLSILTIYTTSCPVLQMSTNSRALYPMETHLIQTSLTLCSFCPGPPAPSSLCLHPSIYLSTRHSQDATCLLQVHPWFSVSLDNDCRAEPSHVTPPRTCISHSLTPAVLPRGPHGCSGLGCLLLPCRVSQ